MTQKHSWRKKSTQATWTHSKIYNKYMTINREAEHTGDQLLFFLTDLYYMSRCKSVGILQVAMMDDIYYNVYDILQC